MCGVIGLWGHASVAARLHDGLLGIQHRGQDAAGIVTYDGDGGFRVRRGGGLVRDLFDAEALAALPGRMGIGHVRYPTMGSGSPDDAQPMLVNHPWGVAMAHNGNVTNFHALKEELSLVDRRLVSGGCDVEAILNVLAAALEKEAGTPFPEAAWRAVEEVFRRAKGAYSVVAIIAGKGMLAFRDPLGIRPLVMGVRETLAGPEVCFASESVVCDLLQFPKVEDVGPGEAVFLSSTEGDGALHRRQVAGRRPQAPCIFEQVYFARPDSTLDGVGVYPTRQRLGDALAAEWRKSGLQADVVIPIPETACASAQAMARALNLPYREGFVKNRYVGRTFIMPGHARAPAVRRKLNAIASEFAGKAVLLVDDSLVRGTTSRSIVQMARQAGASQVFLALCAPPLRFPCVYGIDISTKGELIARDQEVASIARAVGADALVYQEVKGLVRAARAGNPALPRFCTACFTGEYPTEDVTPEIFSALEEDRQRARSAAAR